MWSWMIKGGPLMWPILACSVVAVSVIVERCVYFARLRPSVSNLDTRVRSLLRQQKPEEALRLCESCRGAIPRLMAIALRIRNKPPEERERVLNKYVGRCMRAAERNTGILAIIANVAPLLGLLGTITGMIRAFMQIQRLHGSADVSSLAGGVWEALVTTAFGLMVAIPAMAFYHYFEARINGLLDAIKEAVGDIAEEDAFSAARGD